MPTQAADTKLPEASDPTRVGMELFGEDWKAPLSVKLARIGGLLGPVPKQGFNDMGGKGRGYRFTQETDLVRVIRPLLVAAGIHIQFSVRESEIVNEYEGRGILTKVTLDYTVRDGLEEMHGSMDGYGLDAGDKGIYKAITGAKKYVLMTLLMVDTGDEPEADSDSDALASEGQRLELDYYRDHPEGLGTPADPAEWQAPRPRTRETGAAFSSWSEDDRDPDSYRSSGPTIVRTNRDDIIRGGHTAGATSTQLDRLRQVILNHGVDDNTLRRVIAHTLQLEAPPDLRAFVPSLDPSEMGRLIFSLENLYNPENYE